MKHSVPLWVFAISSAFVIVLATLAIFLAVQMSVVKGNCTTAIEDADKAIDSMIDVYETGSESALERMGSRFDSYVETAELCTGE